MASSDQILLFPHEEKDLLSSIQDLHVRSKTQPKLKCFLKGSCAVIREEALALDSLERDGVGAFEDLVELVEWHVRQNQRNSIVENVLFTVSQLGQLLMYFVPYYLLSRNFNK